MRRPLLLLTSCLVAAALSACAVGPDFETPPTPDAKAYDSLPTPAQTADGAQAFKQGSDIQAQWWDLFHSTKLSALVEKSLNNNPDLASAEASMRVAEDNLATGSAILFPVVSGSFSSQREKTSAASSDGFAPSFIYNLHNASANVSYGLDIFGGTRRSIEALQAQSDAARFQKEAVYLSLTANVVTTAISEASLRAQIDETQKIITDQEKILQALRVRQASGAIAKTIIVTQEQNLATARAFLPPLQHALSVEKHAMAALLGQLPDQTEDDGLTLSDLTLPSEIPLSLPAKLAEQRPDIRQATESLHTASAEIGVAVAARLPQVTLSADIGSMTNMLSKLFSPGGGFWDLGGGASETLFDAGALADQEQAARDRYDAAAGQYRKTVILAFENVADALHALQSDAELFNAKNDADKAAQENLSLVQAQFAAGSISSIDLLNAEQATAQIHAALAQARGQRLADTAALLTALGGGWWNREKSQEIAHD